MPATRQEFEDAVRLVSEYKASHCSTAGCHEESDGEMCVMHDKEWCKLNGWKYPFQLDYRAPRTKGG